MSLYASYVAYVVQTLKNEHMFANFKSSPAYTTMLEHVSSEQGFQYLAQIRENTTFTNDILRQYCAKNDAIGGGIKHNYGFATTSPSNLRYILHAQFVLQHMKDLGMTLNVRVVEIGCGYGGLCLAIAHFAPLYDVAIAEYNLIDLAPVGELQKRYLANASLPFPSNFHVADTYGADIPADADTFVVSAYCFSEIDDALQREYITKLFPKVRHGWFAWNMIPVYDFGFPILKNIQEEPLTGAHNRYVYF